MKIVGLWALSGVLLAVLAERAYALDAPISSADAVNIRQQQSVLAFAAARSFQGRVHVFKIPFQGGVPVIPPPTLDMDAAGMIAQHPTDSSRSYLQLPNSSSDSFSSLPLYQIVEDTGPAPREQRRKAKQR